MSEPLQWQKSSFSGGGSSDDCIELAATSDTAVHIRESDAPTTLLTTGRDTLTALLTVLKLPNR